MNNFDVLIDSDALIGLILEDDAHHIRATEIFDRLIEGKKHVVITNTTIAETATVLSHLSGQEVTRRFLKDFASEKRFPSIFVDEKFHNEALTIFTAQERRGTSFNDCANVAVMRQFKIPYIFSFDKVYKRDFELSVLQNDTII